jgi:DNA repair exonuclease SbcCD ATPase subunit
MKRLLRQAQEKTIELEEKVSSSRHELKKSKEDLEREKKALQEARELNKKKLRRETKTGPNEMDIPQSEVAMTKALEDSQKAILALETQIENMKKDQSHQEEAFRARMSQELTDKEQKAGNEIEELRKKISELQEELKKQKRLMRPEGHKIDLKALSDEAASEFARVFRKAEQHERLHGIARAKLHLAQEKFTELQKRYFNVCRELAVLSGKGDMKPAEARDIAEKIVAEGHHGINENQDHSVSEEERT